jgi:hypothetical protein
MGAFQKYTNKLERNIKFLQKDLDKDNLFLKYKYDIYRKKNGRK